MEPQRYPISVRLVGIMHKEKRKMYLVSVLWSDQNDIVVYRTFRDFQRLHKQMKRAFPASSKLKRSDRVIPKFRYKREKRSPQMKSAARSLMRLKFLQKYCDDLLGCDPRVCQSTDLVQFFHPTQQDLQPEFSKNSILVMPSEDDKSSAIGGNVTKPFVTETYCCVAAYETKDTKNKPFKVAPNEKVDVLIKDKAGWWLVENEEKQMAWFPAPYLEKLDNDSGDEDEVDDSTERGARYTAVKNYTATKNDEITVSIGAVVDVLQESDNGWWLVRYKEKAGYIPSVYLQPYNYPHIRLTSSRPEPHNNTPQLQIPSLGQQFSRSQENLLTLPSSRPSSPRLLQPETKQKSRSLNVLNVDKPTPASVVPSFNGTHSNGSAPQHVPPTITVQMDDEEDDDVEGRSLGDFSRGSFDSESDYSFSDDLSLSSGGSSLNLNEDRHSRTPEPSKSTHLSPTMGARLMPSVSDPNLFKSPASPKIPPRPKPQQILSRCTTVTRKNAARRSESPTN